MSRVSQVSRLVGAPDSAKLGWHLSDRQKEAQHMLTGPATHIGLIGGARSGKTLLFTRAVTIRALRAPMSRHGIFRFRQNAVKTSVLYDTFPNVMRSCFPNVSYDVSKMDGMVMMPNKSEIWFGGLDEKDRVDKILGTEYATIFLNECSQIAYATASIVRTRLAQKVEGLKLRGYYDLNPGGSGHWTNKLFLEKRDPRTLAPIPDPDRYAWMYMNPTHNRENLPEGYIEEELETLPERQRKRFLEGVYQPEVEGALWSFEGIERSRCEPGDVPKMQRIVVAVDPSGTAGKAEKRNDDIGIVVAGLGFDGRVYLLEDLTCSLAPEGWGRRVVAAYHKHGADRVVGETNFGGDMVRYVIQSIDSGVPFMAVTASRGKAIRAEPVAVLYEEKQDKVRHVGRFTKLEDQLMNFSTSGYMGERSPDRADAWIWAVTDLVISSNAESWIEFYKQQIADNNKPSSAGVVVTTEGGNENRPWQQPVNASAPQNDLVTFYESEVKKLMGEDDVICKYCKKPITTGSRTSDGVETWHAPSCPT